MDRQHGPDKPIGWRSIGSGTAAGTVARELERLGASKVMVIASERDRGLAERVTASAPVALRYHEVVMHVPAGVAARAREAAARSGADALVSIGGGSATALAHCVDAMWAPNAGPIDRALATEGIRALRAGLPAVVADPASLAGREQALYAAYLSAVAFASAGSGLHHKICHVLGGAYNLPQAQTHAVVLPYVLAFNGPARPEAERRIAAALGAERAVGGLQEFRDELQAPRALRDCGFREYDIPAAAEAILPAVPPSNPRPVTAGDLQRLLHAAWAGADPAAW